MTAIPAWQQREIDRQLAMFECASVDDQGVVHWKSNNQVPMKDMLTLWRDASKPFNFELSLATRNQETSEFLRGVREAALTQPRDPEVEAERAFEMRAAFGPGQKIVNVITGEVHKT